MGTTRRTRTLAVIAGLGLVAGVAVAAPAQAERATKEAKGEPIRLGFISLENSPVASFPESREAAEAAVEYLNEERGGVDGHPIDLVVCKATGTPEASSKCANEFVEQDVVAVTGGADLGTDVSVPILEQAGIPLVGVTAVGLTEYTSPDSYLFVGGSLAEWTAQDQFIAEKLKAKSVAIVHADIPQGALAATTFGKDLLTKGGIDDVKLVPEDQNAPDFTSALTIATEDDPDVVMIQLAGQACAGVMQAKQSLGIDATFVYSGGCTDQKTLDQAGAGARGDIFSTEMTFYTDTKDKQVALYRKVLEKYAPKKTVLSLLSQIGFSSVMNLRDLFDQIGFENVTSESLRQALDATKDQANFMAHPYTCDREQTALATAVCNTYVLIMRYENGKMVDASKGWVSGTSLLG